MIGELMAAARKAAENAHAPYSKFAVGAAVLLADGEVVTGCNFENASFGMTLCAETVALASVNTMGRIRDVREIAVVGGPIGPEGCLTGTAIVTPCGRCRQVIREVADMAKTDIVIHCGSFLGEEVKTHPINVLLPDAFGPASMGLV